MHKHNQSELANEGRIAPNFRLCQSLMISMKQLTAELKFSEHISLCALIIMKHVPPHQNATYELKQESVEHKSTLAEHTGALVMAQAGEN